MPHSSATTDRARAFVDAHRAASVALGREAGELVNDPALVVRRLRDGLPDLADAEYLEGERLIAPGIGALLGVRNPLLSGVGSGFRAATRRDRPTALLSVAEHLLREELLELRWLAFPILGRTIAQDPERAWQLVRLAAREAADWITVDSLAHVAARGIVSEPYRWAELEQLVYSPSRWERRLVGSTVATLPYEDRVLGRRPDIAARGLDVLRELIGDASPDVQKAISWAMRSLTIVDAGAVTTFARTEAATAAATADGHRAWVVRDGVDRLPDATAASIRASVEGIRKRPGAPSTSRAAEAAAAFTGLGVAVPPAERPIVARP